MAESPGDILKAVAALLSNLGGTFSRAVVSSADVIRLQRAWDEYHGIPPTESRLYNVLGLAPYDAQGHAPSCDRVDPGQFHVRMVP
jgi:hypothetical protein